MDQILHRKSRATKLKTINSIHQQFEDFYSTLTTINVFPSFFGSLCAILMTIFQIKKRYLFDLRSKKIDHSRIALVHSITSMLKEIKTFLAVVRYGTFAAAGTRLGLTQSAVSAQIQRLENALGAPLFDRTGRSVVLNAAGEEAKATAQHIVDAFHEMSERVTSRELRGGLKVGAIQTVQAGLLPTALQRLHSRHPQVAVRLIQGSSLALMAQVDSGEIDAALMVLSPFSLPSELFWQPLLKEPFVLAVPATDRRDDWRELLSTYPVIRYDRASFGGRVVEQFFKRNMVDIHASIEMEDVEGMVKMVASGLGIALVPQSRPGFLPDNVRAVSLNEATFYREIGLVFLGSGERAGLVGALRHCLQSAAYDMPSAHEALRASSVKR